ncbi:YiiX/YebB-like N1pC/P60 family cysteine hydrolase, partial [Verrucomicrobiota bacterium]
MIAMQYLTDLLDGAIGRQRNTGLVKWGYYMDHFLDYIFLCSILIGYALLLPDAFKYILFYIMAFFGAFMVNSFLSFAATNSFTISYCGIGPTEIRIVFILVNTLIIVFGRSYMLKAVPYVLGAATFGLFVAVFRTQKALWAEDMRRKHGEAGDVDQEPGIGEMAHDIITGVSRRRILRGIFFSVGLTTAAALILVLRVLHPHHRTLAAALYVLGWILFLRSWKEKRGILRKHGRAIRKQVRPYLLHVVIAVALVVVGRAAWVLAPTDVTPLGRMTQGELRTSIAADMENLRILNANVQALAKWSRTSGLLSRSVEALTPEEKELVRGFWGDFVEACTELEILKRRYRGFYQIDYLVDPEMHTRAFLTAFGAFATQYAAALDVTGDAARSPFLGTMLNEADPERHIPEGSYDALKRRTTHPDEMLRLNAGAAYLALIKNRATSELPLVRDIESKLRRIYKMLGRSPERLIEAPLDLLEREMSSVWFPFQKDIAIGMSLIRTKDRPNFVTPELIARYKDLLQPGDILLERRNWYMTNVGIPGFWPHAALYVGTPDEVDAFCGGVGDLQSPTASAWLEQHCPAAVANWRTAVDGQARVIEALRDGVVFTSLERSANADYLAVLRPRVSRGDVLQTIRAAFTHAGKPYDFNFDFATDGALVCSELVYKAFKGHGDLNLELSTLNGRLILPPNLIVKKFDREFGTPQQQLDLVLFLDGSESASRAVARGVDEFRASWQRPKWDVLQK